MRIDLLCDNLLTRTRLQETWKRAGCDVRRLGDEVGDFVVVDLSARGAIERIGELRARLPEVEILAFGPHVNGEAFKAARAAGATRLVARGSVLDRVLRRLRS